jgi:Domain of unknown function (DUF4145)
MSTGWQSLQSVKSRGWACGYCGQNVASTLGYECRSGGIESVLICPHCDKPTYFNGDVQVPGVAFGHDVDSLPQDVEALYREARNCMAANAYTPAVLACRKLLMHIAVAQGADAGQAFTAYVEHLSSKGFVPPTGKKWVDYIRSKSNEANHEIKLMGRADAESLLRFIEMLLELVFAFPAQVPA